MRKELQEVREELKMCPGKNCEVRGHQVSWTDSGYRVISTPGASYREDIEAKFLERLMNDFKGDMSSAEETEVDSFWSTAKTKIIHATDYKGYPLFEVELTTRPGAIFVDYVTFPRQLRGRGELLTYRGWDVPSTLRPIIRRDSRELHLPGHHKNMDRGCSIFGFSSEEAHKALYEELIEVFTEVGEYIGQNFVYKA